MSDLAERLASFERALVEMLAKRSWAKREQWCGCIDCHSMIAPRALSPSSAPRRPDPTPDKINEAFEQATRCGNGRVPAATCNMVEKNAYSFGSFMLHRNDGLQTARGRARSIGIASDIWHGRGRQAPGAREQVRQSGVRPQGRSPDYPVVAAWAGFLLFVGAGAFALGTAIHNEASAQQHAPRPEQIYYCATDVEMPAFEPCKEMKGQRDIR